MTTCAWKNIGCSLQNILPSSWKRIVESWLKEDVPSLDYGGFVVGEKPETAVLYGKSEGVLAGVPFFEEIFKQLECNVEWCLKEGENISPVMKIAIVRGPAKNILLGERVSLNIISRCSGIATKSIFYEYLKKLGYHGVVAGTRKTTPGFRLVEKYGMLVGGVDPHRFDLRSITKAVEAARLVGGFSLKIEVEVRSEAEADEAILSGADIIMLDNFHNDNMKTVAKNLKQKWKNKPKFLLECSGGITEENAHEFICNDLDILSISSIHQGVKHVDFSLKIHQI
ncbi:hypothetical protein PMAC_000023 [Pneumocystis sp. 'macacae']|nr:hypothetical protein PMAC_000023 [Pneumocystis sp. 'macacae']